MVAHSDIDHTGLTGVSAPAFVGVRCRAVADVALTNGSVVYLTFDTEDYDTDGFHSTSSNTSRLTVPSGQAGYYRLAAASLTTSSPGDGYCVFRKNGTTLMATGAWTNASNAGHAAATTTLQLAEGDYMEFGIRVGAGSKSAIDAGVADPFFEMVKVG